jgi:hypothetical protein
MGDDAPQSAVTNSKPVTTTSSVRQPSSPAGENFKEATTVFDAALEISAIYDRLRKLESPPKENKEHWYDSQLFSSVLSGVILAVFGFFLTGRLEQSAKERELNIQSANGMQELLVKMSTAKGYELEATAVTLTAFGRYAILPLIQNLQSTPERAIAAEHGLDALAITVPEDLCASLGAVLQNQTQQYTAASHTSVIRIMGVAACTGKDQVKILQDYADQIKKADAGGPGLIEYQQHVRDATQSNVTQTKQELTTTFRLLHVDYSF